MQTTRDQTTTPVPPATCREASILFRLLDSGIFLGALVSVTTLQSWRWIDLRFAGGFTAFFLPWLWLLSLILLQLLRYRPATDISIDSAWRLNRMLLLPSAIIAVVLLLNTLTFYHLKMALHGRMPWYVPMCLPVLIVLCGWLVLRPDYVTSVRCAKAQGVGAPWRSIRYTRYDLIFMAGMLFILLWIFHGMFLSNPPPRAVDADVAVVLGAGTGPGDTCGYTLRQRVLEGVALYKMHRTKRLLLTGRAPRGSTNPYENEPLAMLKLALAKGVPAKAIIVDYHGNNTRFSAYDAVALIKAAHWHKVIAVSSEYHLPRTALAFRQLGVNVWTVPALAGIWRQANPWAIVRELAGYPVYWLDQNYHRPEHIP
jgi:uncharacterized SAM-binding protein YcdF (DUF218 family)